MMDMSEESLLPDQTTKEGAPHVWTVNDQLEVFLAELRITYSDPNGTTASKVAPLYEEVNLDMLAQLSEHEMAYAQALKDIDKITGLGVKVLKDAVDKHKAKSARGIKDKGTEDKVEHEEFEKSVKDEADEIFQRGEAYGYIYKIWQKRVKGNALLGKILIVSRGVSSGLNTKGLHIYAHGQYGQGKSHGMEIGASLLPDEFVKDTDVSPKVLYYMQGADLLRPATTFLMDDLDINGPLADLYKKITTKFQKGAGHTVVMDGEVLELKLPPRVNIWTNSVEFQGDEQVRDRFLDVQIDESQTKNIIEHMKQADQNTLDEEDSRFEIAVCQELYRTLANQTFYVEIPFARDIDFPVSENTRGYAIFSDLIKGLAALRFSTRKRDGRGHLLADLNDFKEAKALYEGLSGHSEQKFGTSEKAVLKAIIANGGYATLDQLHKATGLSESRLKDIFNGRSKDEQKKASGLLSKCSALKLRHETITDTVDGKRKTYRVNVYSLDEDFRLVDEEQELIKLNSSEVMT